MRYIPSKLRSGETEFLREHSFTRWMSADLLQASVDFCKHTGQLPLYCEVNSDKLTRYLIWNKTAPGFIEIRTGRTREKFAELDAANFQKGHHLLSLHVSKADIFSAVWIGPAQYEEGKRVLGFYGITPAERHEK